MPIQAHKSISWIILFIFAFCTYLPLISGYNIIFDETYSLLLTNQPWKEMFVSIIQEDGHPPLYYILLKGWMDLFASSYQDTFTARFLNIFFIFGTALLGASPIRKLLGDKIGFYFSILILFSPFSFYLVKEIRMYGLGMFCLMGSFVYAHIVLSKGSFKNWGVLFLFTLAGLYTHYIVAFSMGLIFLYLGIRLLLQKNVHQIKWFILSSVFLAILYIPWLPAYLTQYSLIKDSWYPNSVFFWQTFQNLFYGQIVYKTIEPYQGLSIFYTLYVWAILLIFILDKEKNNEKKQNYFIWGLLFLPIGFLTYAIFISIFIRPMLDWRYTVIFLPFFSVAAIIILMRFKPVFTRFFFILFTLNSLGYYLVFLNYFSDMERPKFIKSIEETLPQDAVVMFNIPSIHLFMNYYFPNIKYATFKTYDFPILLRHQWTDNDFSKKTDLLRTAYENDKLFYFTTESPKSTQEPMIYTDSFSFWEYRIYKADVDNLTDLLKKAFWYKQVKSEQATSKK